jgi:hypothetical protein
MEFFLTKIDIYETMQPCLSYRGFSKKKLKFSSKKQGNLPLQFKQNCAHSAPFFLVWRKEKENINVHGLPKVNGTSKYNTRCTISHGIPENLYTKYEKEIGKCQQQETNVDY